MPESLVTGSVAVILFVVAVACLGDAGRRASARRVLAMLLSREARQGQEASVDGPPARSTMSTKIVVKSKTITKTTSSTMPARSKKKQARRCKKRRNSTRSATGGNRSQARRGPPAADRQDL